MLHHTGERRSRKENFSLAILLAGAAGIVNATGLLECGVLTTNVTGHMAGWATASMSNQIFPAYAYMGWMLLFLAGALTSGLITSAGYRYFPRFRFTLPILLEISILLYVASTGTVIHMDSRTVFWDAGLLLYAMGIQNALVTVISGAVIRTTHLTGLFTDLGIELGELLWCRKADERVNILKIMSLHLGIIIAFACGGMLSAFLYPDIGTATFYFAICILILSAVFDATLLWYFRMRRKIPVWKRQLLKKQGRV